MTTIIIPQHAIHAVSFAMGNKDIRYYLNGMLIEHNGAETRMIATNGHRLHAALTDGLRTVWESRQHCPRSRPRWRRRLPHGLTRLADCRMPDWSRLPPENMETTPALIMGPAITRG